MFKSYSDSALYCLNEILNQLKRIIQVNRFVLILYWIVTSLCVCKYSSVCVRVYSCVCPCVFVCVLPGPFWREPVERLERRRLAASLSLFCCGFECEMSAWGDQTGETFIYCSIRFIIKDVYCPVPAPPSVSKLFIILYI